MYRLVQAFNLAYFLSGAFGSVLLRFQNNVFGFLQFFQLLFLSLYSLIHILDCLFCLVLSVSKQGKCRHSGGKNRQNKPERVCLADHIEQYHSVFC